MHVCHKTERHSIAADGSKKLFARQREAPDKR
jgi:hypothetical protein